MKHREATLKKLDSLESTLSKLNLSLNQGNRELCYELIETLREQIAQIKTYIESEPLAGYEINNI